MIVLDTNVVSELFRPHPEPAVLDWFDERPADEFVLTAITAAELVAGVLRLPDGRRRSELGRRVVAVIDEDFAGRVLPFGVEAVVHYGEITAACERLGRPIGMADAQIAAICQSVSAPLATRKTGDFEPTGVELVDPWSIES